MKYVLLTVLPLFIGFGIGHYLRTESDDISEEEFEEIAVHITRYIEETQFCPFCQSDLKKRV